MFMFPNQLLWRATLAQLEIQREIKENERRRTHEQVYQALKSIAARGLLPKV